MVKKLLIVRHAESGETDHGSKDIERYLTRSGQREAVHTGMYIKRHDLIPNLMVTSAAVRAFQTAQIIAEQIKYPAEEIQEDPELYDASVRIFLRIVNELDVNCQSVLFVGHNPTVSYMAELLTGETVGNMEPGSLVEIHFPMDSWKEVSQNTGKLIQYITPGQIEEDEHKPDN
ncbi:histidine phosphatase family protein [Imperialibacter roseus]|uniref:Histidine phosphatase family protein n=1 Tax=Imperialibacter roseus TaxID=1324217 RepID=A0ABZ0IIC4_9BACT|nr:histidine phosphatase family protein [Imperialibacter roseus]WOK04788.1 histidine phosphatase family protein [Imperialibacter roseus]|tara:strand:- start:788 stop:1309 length:522 start_codon:yes stop_codon:yes gene_type:complete